VLIKYASDLSLSISAEATLNGRLINRIACNAKKYGVMINVRLLILTETPMTGLPKDLVTSFLVKF